jgi:DNA (cytosine-5)-methyltransferase 1
MNYIDLFAGAGGLSEGFIRAGFEPIAHVEVDEAACLTLKTRTAFHYLKSKNKLDTYLAYLKGEIDRSRLYETMPQELLDSIINLPIGEKDNKEIFRRLDLLLQQRPVDLIIGGPPCQAYSLVGRARSKTKMEGDPRNFLYKEYGKYLQYYQPKYFVFENVIGLKSAKGGEYLDSMESLFKQVGYFIKPYTVEARNFDILQNRKRIIIIGWRKDIEFEAPTFLQSNSLSTLMFIRIDVDDLKRQFEIALKPRLCGRIDC